MTVDSNTAYINPFQENASYTSRRARTKGKSKSIEWNTEGWGALPGTVDGGGHGLRKTRPRAASGDGEEDHERTGRAAGWPALKLGRDGNGMASLSCVRSSRLSFPGRAGPGLIVTAHWRWRNSFVQNDGQGKGAKCTNGNGFFFCDEEELYLIITGPNLYDVLQDG